MSGTYDEETRKLLETRKRRAEIRRAQQIKKRNTMLLGIGALALLIILISVISSSCSSNKADKKETVTQSKQVETTAEAATQTDGETEAVTTQPADNTADGQTKYTTDVLNLRKEPTTKADIITQIDAGKKVTIVSDENEWCKVKYDKETGYVKKEFLSDKNTVE